MANTVITVNPETGTTTNTSDLQITPGNHDNMPARTEAYEPTDERGHNNASSVDGSNEKNNVFPQSRDLNHGAYLQMEKGEKDVLKANGNIHSEKTAFISNQPGGRPDAFIVNDHVTHANGVTQDVHFSFTNLSNAEQESMNASLQNHTDMLNDPNPGDTLRDHMSAEEYSHLMETTDSSMPGIRDSYSNDWTSGISADTLNTSDAVWSYDSAESSDAFDAVESFSGSSAETEAAETNVSADGSVAGSDGAEAEGAGPDSADDGGASYESD